MPYRKREKHDNQPMILISLPDGPRTLPEIEQQFRGFIQRLGFFPPVYDDRSDPPDHFALELREDMGRLIELGWIARQGELYALTEAGQAQADKALSEVRQTVGWARKMMQPETVSQVAVVATRSRRCSCDALEGETSPVVLPTVSYQHMRHGQR